MAVVAVALSAVLAACDSQGLNQATYVRYCGQPTLGIVGEDQTRVLDLTRGARGIPRLDNGRYLLYSSPGADTGPDIGPQVIVKLVSGCASGATVTFTSPSVVRIIGEDKARDGRPVGLGLTGGKAGTTTLVVHARNGSLRIPFRVVGPASESPTARK